MVGGDRGLASPSFGEYEITPRHAVNGHEATHCICSVKRQQPKGADKVQGNEEKSRDDAPSLETILSNEQQLYLSTLQMQMSEAIRVKLRARQPWFGENVETQHSLDRAASLEVNRGIIERSRRSWDLRFLVGRWTLGVQGLRGRRTGG